MTSQKDDIIVNLKDRAYPIYIKDDHSLNLNNIFSDLGLSKSSTIITHPSLEAHYGQGLKNQLQDMGHKVDLLLVPEGEQSKSTAIALGLVDDLLSKKVDRKHNIIALGGGVIGDLAGFVAAITLRGIQLIQYPTTLLAQVDSAIGGKTGVNSSQGKNLIGAFYQPKATISNISTLKTLPKKEILAGLAEVVKYGVIEDEKFFSYLETNETTLKTLDVTQNPEVWQHIISTSAKIKAKVVTADEKESGLRAILNFGHTFAHAIESVFGYGSFLHGEAVALGMKSAGFMAEKLGLFQDQERLTALLTRLGFNLTLPKMNSLDLVKVMYSDKKVLDNTIRFILPTKIGEVKLEAVTDEALMAESFEQLMEGN